MKKALILLFFMAGCICVETDPSPFEGFDKLDSALEARTGTLIKLKPKMDSINDYYHDLAIAAEEYAASLHRLNEYLDSIIQNME